MSKATNLPMNLLAAIGDPDGTRTVTSIIALLVALGLALAMIAVWVYKTTRPDPELLAPLEAMGERRWRRADPVGQRRTLDGVRPDDAAPLTPSAAPPDLDEAFDAGPSGAGFDDLHADADADAEDKTGIETGIEDKTVGRPVVPSMRSNLAPPGGETTPQQIQRPDVDVFSDDFDPDVLAAADAELDAELHRESGAD